MKQTTKFLHIVMCMVLGLSVSMTSCKDYDDDIDGLNQRVDALEKSLSELSTDFGELAYVKSVSFADGVLTVTPATGSAVTYTIPDEDTNTTYSLDVTSDGQKVTITMTGSDGSKKDVSFDLPQSESFNGQELTVDEDGYICYNGIPTGVKLPEASSSSFDASKLTIGEDNCVYYDGEKTGVQLDKFNPAMLTLDKDGNILYNGEKTGVALPSTLGGMTMTEIKDEAGTVIGYSIIYGEMVANLKVQSGTLQNLVFIPDFYYQGIEAMSAYTFYYNSLDKMMKGEGLADLQNGKYTEPTVGDEASVTPNLVARYHLNPSNVSIDLLNVKNMSFLAEDKAYTKAAGVVVPEIIDRTVENGILTVQANLSEGLLKDIAIDEKVTVLALQVGTKGVAGDTLITSDYAAVKPVRVAGFDLAYSELPLSEDAHLYATLNEAIAANEEKGDIILPLVWNDADGIDVATLVQTHIDRISDDGEPGVHEALDDNASTGVINQYGLKYSYELIGYTTGNNVTSQSAHAAFDGNSSIMRAQMTVSGKQAGFGESEQSRATIGRMPIVRVVLTDTISNKDVAVGYMKFEIKSDEEAPSEDDFKEIDLAPWTNPYTVSCSDTLIEYSLDWVRVEEQIYSALNMSKDEFEQHYTLDGFVEETETPATQYVGEGLKATEAKPNEIIGEVLITTEDGASSMTEVLTWTITPDEAYNLFTKEQEPISAMVRFTRTNSNGSHHYVYVTFTWAPSVYNVKPQGEILDNADTKFPNAWFAHNSNTQGWDEVHFNVAVPTTEGDNNSANCTFENNVLNVFIGQEVLVSNVAPVYYDFQTGLKTTFKFITPDVTEVKGVNGKTYVLSVSTDGTRLIATEKNTTNSADVAVLSGSTGNYTNYEVAYQENAIAKEVLNYADHTDLGDGQTLTAKVQMNVVNKCDKPIKVLNNEFDVKFLRPISVLEIADDVLQDGLNGGDEIELADVLEFTDWREYSFADYSNLFGFYGVSAINVDINAVTIDLGNGSYKPLKEVSPAINVKYTPATGTISIDNMGTFSWTNSGFTLSADAVLSLPVEISYKWGTVKKEIHVTVKKTVGQD